MSIFFIVVILFSAQESVAPKTVPKPVQQPITILTEPEIPKEPPPEWEFMIDPPSISRRHL